jgi:hypothetical protein
VADTSATLDVWAARLGAQLDALAEFASAEPEVDQAAAVATRVLELAGVTVTAETRRAMATGIMICAGLSNEGAGRELTAPETGAVRGLLQRI